MAHQPATPKEIVSFQFPAGLSSAFDADAFDEAIQAHGVRFVHYRGMRDPVGLIDRYDSRRPDEDHVGASNGLVYTKAGVLAALFTGNSKELRQAEGGMMDAGTASITPARFYECTTGDNPEQVYLHTMDRLYLEEKSVLVTHQQLVEAHETGKDRLRFPAVKVQDVMDATGTRYKAGTDYKVCDGGIEWLGDRRPGANVEAGKGRVYAVRYLYRPYWIVHRMLHEVRVAQQEDPITGGRLTVAMPQAAVVQREYIYEGSEANDDQAPPSQRQAKPPADGGFGPR